MACMDAVFVLQDEDYIKSTSDKLPDVGKKMEYMLNTGNLVSKTGLDISQATGFTVVAEKLNFFRFTPPSPLLLSGCAQAEFHLLCNVRCHAIVCAFKPLLYTCMKALAGTICSLCWLLMLSAICCTMSGVIPLFVHAFKPLVYTFMTALAGMICSLCWE